MSMNMPFQPQDETPLPTEGVMLSGGVAVMAILADTTTGRMPALMFRFAKANGTGFYPATVLGCDDFADLKALAPLIQQAVKHLERVTGS